jgi:hypothetical protein
MLLKQPTQPISPRAFVGSHAGGVHIAPKRRIRMIIGPSNSTIDDELAQVRIAWRKFQSSRKRDAVYWYLSALCETVRWWRKDQRVKASSRQALRATGRAAKIRNLEPFGIIILCTSDPHKVDAKTRSKWSRLLRYAKQFKPDTKRLAEFVKGQGGINECAARWSDRTRRTGEKSLSRSPAARF